MLVASKGGILVDGCAADFREATAICGDFGNKQCLEAAFALMKHFGSKAEVLFLCTDGKAARPYIGCEGHRAAISDTGNHFAVIIHDLVFDNLHHKGEPLANWLSNFYYASLHGEEARFHYDEIQRMSYSAFRDYLVDDPRFIFESDDIDDVVKGQGQIL